MAYNWVERSAKGLRLDSGSNVAFVPEEVNNTIHANVALMTHGFELKVSKTTPNILSHFILKMIHLPRQARDEHRENSNIESVFLKNDYNFYTNNLALWPPPNGTVRGGASTTTTVSGQYAFPSIHGCVSQIR